MTKLACLNSSISGYFYVFYHQYFHHQAYNEDMNVANEQINAIQFNEKTRNQIPGSWNRCSTIYISTPIPITYFSDQYSIRAQCVSQNCVRSDFKAICMNN